MQQLEMIFDQFYDEVDLQRSNNFIPSIDNCISWLDLKGLMRTGRDLRIRNGTEFYDADSILFGLSAKRAEKKTKAEIDIIIKQYNEASLKKELSADELELLWKSLNNPRTFHFFDVKRISSDALGFYRPFHFSPFDDWGIYLITDKILEYYEQICFKLGSNLRLFQSDILLGYILFEIFHHEFFHHIVESASTSLEIISAAFGQPKPLYMNYFYSNYHKINGLGKHLDDPLEEALANAYAYNSFSFLSRVGVGYKSLLVKSYQEAMLKDWIYAPPGYRSAPHYIDSRYMYGATQLLAMVLGSSSVNPASSAIVAKKVLLNGHTAFCSKPDIPTYLVGTSKALEIFYKLIPAPNATYTNLFWHEDLNGLDKYFQDKKKQESSQKTKLLS